MRRLPCLLPLLAAVAVAAGCGPAASGDRPEEDLSVLLDFTANGVHAPFYVAQQRDFDEAEGVTVRLRQPSGSSDALKLLAGGRTDVAVLDVTDVALARAEGAQVRCFAALVQRPLAALYTRKPVTRPRELEGERAGVTGLPSDDAVLASVVAGDGGDPDAVRATTIGFNAVQALVGGKVAGVTAFWSVEGLQLQRRLAGDVREFRVDDLGAPPYPELLLCATPETVEERRDALLALVKALQRGALAAQTDPESAAGAIAEAVRGTERSDLLEQVEAVAPAWTEGAEAFGQLKASVLRDYARWGERFGLLEEPFDVDAAIDDTFVTRLRNP